MCGDVRLVFVCVQSLIHSRLFTNLLGINCSNENLKFITKGKWELLAHCALSTLLTYTVFKREGILEDFAHFYGVGRNIFSPRKVGIFWNWRFYLCGLNLRETCRKLKAFVLCFQVSRLFRVDARTQSSLSWRGSLRVNSLMLQLLWKMSLNTGGNGRFFIYVIDKAILIPLIPGFARLLLHVCLYMLALPNAFALVSYISCVKATSESPFCPADDTTPVGLEFQRIHDLSNKCTYSETCFFSWCFIYSVCFLLSLFQMVGHTWKLSIISDVCSVYLCCKYLNICSRGTTFIDC